MINLNGKDSRTRYYFSFENDCVYELPWSKAEFEKQRRNLTQGLGWLLGGLLIFVGISLIYCMPGKTKDYMELAIPLLMLVFFAIAMHSVQTAQKQEEEHVLKYGKSREDLSAEEVYRIVWGSNKLFVKCFFFLFFEFLLFTGAYVAYMTGLEEDMRALLVGVLGVPTTIPLLMWLKPIQRLKLLLYLKRKAQQER